MPKNRSAIPLCGILIALLGTVVGCGGGETPTEHAVHEQGWSGQEAKELSHALEKAAPGLAHGEN